MTLSNNQIKKTNTYKHETPFFFFFFKIINDKKMQLLFTYQKHETFLGNNVSGKFGMK